MAALGADVNNVPRVLLLNTKAPSSETMLILNLEVIPWDNPSVAPQISGTDSVELSLLWVCYRNTGLTLPEAEKSLVLNGPLLLNG